MPNAMLHATRIAASMSLMSLMAPGALLVSGMAIGVATDSAKAQVVDLTVADNATLLADYIHFVRIDRHDVAAAVGAELLNRGLAPREFVPIVDGLRDSGSFEQTLARATRFPVLESSAEGIDKLYRSGLLDLARDADQIARNIELLSGTVRGRMLARDRLVAAGEYAMPQLLEAFYQSRDPNLRAQVQSVLLSMGRQAVTPLSVALPKLDPVRQELTANVLGLLNYRSALPVLTEVYQTSTVSATRDSAQRAIERLGGDPQADLAGLYYLLADGYYLEREELTSFPGEDMQLYWDYDPGVGMGTVVATAMTSEVYHEAMAMRYAARSIELAPNLSEESLALWIAANFSREIDTPAGYDNPLYPDSYRDANYFAAAAGAEIGQSVLRRALADNDTPLALRAIEAIDLTAGGRTLWEAAAGGARPLVEALGYPNRRVRTEAALALGRAQPRVFFSGADRVVPILAGAIRDAESNIAVVLASDTESYQARRRMLEAEGYAVLPTARTLLEIAEPISEAPAIDLIVMDLSAEAANAEIERARANAKLEATPVFLLTESTAFDTQQRRYRRDASVSIRRIGVTESQMVAAIDQLMLVAAGGPITAAQAREFTTQALDTLRDLAVERNEILVIDDAALPLIAALNKARGNDRIAIGEILARIGQERTQQALMDTALDSTGSARISMLQLVGDSAKRFGNLLATRQERRLIELARAQDSELATVAAAVVGALELPRDSLAPEILSATGRPQQARRDDTPR